MVEGVLSSPQPYKGVEMRGLKVRAWVNEHWVDWLPNSKTLGEYNEVGIYADEYNTDGECFIEQYTGLKDKNGKEIYEGDIVKYKLYADSRLDYVDEVFYSTTSGAFMVGDEYNIRTLDCLINIEVIGNIHELNKEEE